MQPERYIEKLLRAFAKKRRDQAGDAFGLHPVTRRMLQGEVARRHARSDDAQTLSWRSLIRLWPRIAFATASLAVLVAAALLLFPPTPKSQPAQQHASQPSTAPDRGAESLLPAPAAPPASVRRAMSEVSDDKEHLASTAVGVAPLPAATEPRIVLKSDTEQERSSVQADLASAVVSSKPVTDAFNNPVAPTSPQLGFASAPVLAENLAVEEQLRSYGTKAKGVAVLSAGFSRTNATPELARADRRRNQTPADGGLAGVTSPVAGREARESERFADLERAGGASSTVTGPVTQLLAFARADLPSPRAPQRANGPQAVLASFQLEQRGSEIRIVDADGSVYTGAVQLAELPAAAMAARSQATSRRSAMTRQAAYGDTTTTGTLAMEVAQPPPAVNFTVSGTNATLRQGMVFIGSLQAEAAAQAADSRVQGTTAVYQNQLSAPLPMANQLSNSRLTGRVRLANGVELQINAQQRPADTSK